MEYTPKVITLEETKDYLRIEQDYIDEDQRLLKPFIIAAEGYLETHIGEATFEAMLNDPKAKAKGKIYCFALVSEWYDNRGSDGVSNRLKNTLMMIGEQLKYGVVLPSE